MANFLENAFHKDATCSALDSFLEEDIEWVESLKKIIKESPEDVISIPVEIVFYEKDPHFTFVVGTDPELFKFEITKTKPMIKKECNELFPQLIEVFTRKARKLTKIKFTTRVFLSDDGWDEPEDEPTVDTITISGYLDYTRR